MDRFGARDLPCVMLSLRRLWMGMVFLSMVAARSGKGRSMRRCADSFQSVFHGPLIWAVYDGTIGRAAALAPVRGGGGGTALQPRGAPPAHDAAAADAGHRPARAAAGGAPV